MTKHLSLRDPVTPTYCLKEVIEMEVGTFITFLSLLVVNKNTKCPSLYLTHQSLILLLLGFSQQTLLYCFYIQFSFLI